MRSPLKTHGGKRYLARRIVSLMAPHTTYVEPYAGGLSVLLAKDPGGTSEVANDLDEALTDFWAALADPTHFAEFLRKAEATPFSEVVWNDASFMLDPGRNLPLPQRAWAFFVCCRQSLAGRMDSFAALTKSRLRRGMNEQVSAWLSAVDGLPEVHARLRRVLILNRDALGVIRQFDGPDTLYYLDPPYLEETRTAPRVYAHEMTDRQHSALLGLLSDPDFKGKFMLSGYRSKLYDLFAEGGGWRRVEWELPNNAAGGDSKRRMKECLWLNYDIPGVTSP